MPKEHFSQAQYLNDLPGTQTALRTCLANIAQNLPPAYQEGVNRTNYYYLNKDQLSTHQEG